MITYCPYIFPRPATPSSHSRQAWWCRDDDVGCVCVRCCFSLLWWLLLLVLCVLLGSWMFPHAAQSYILHCYLSQFIFWIDHILYCRRKDVWRRRRLRRGTFCTSWYLFLLKYNVFSPIMNCFCYVLRSRSPMRRNCRLRSISYSQAPLDSFMKCSQVFRTLFFNIWIYLKFFINNITVVYNICQMWESCCRMTSWEIP